MRPAVPRSLCVAAILFATVVRADDASLHRALQPLERLSRTGVLYDRVVPLAHLEKLDGSASAPVTDLATWRQAYDELRRASVAPPTSPDLEAVVDRARAAQRAGVIPLALIDRAFDRVRPGALADGAIVAEGGQITHAEPSALIPARAFVATALVPGTFRGASVTFVLDPADIHADQPIGPGALSIDFDDGAGARAVAPGEPVHVTYAAAGRHVLALSLARMDGTVSRSRFAFDVTALATPLPIGQSELVHPPNRDVLRNGWGLRSAVDCVPIKRLFLTARSAARFVVRLGWCRVSRGSGWRSR